MKKLSLFLIVLASLFTRVTNPADAQTKTPTIVVSGRTVVALFPVADAKSQQDPNTNEALADFQLYAGQVRESFKKVGIEFHELYTRSFQVRVGKVVKVFRPEKAEVGYYFIAPGKEPRIEYGVMTDGDLLQVANEYFGPSAKCPAVVSMSDNACYQQLSLMNIDRRPQMVEGVVHSMKNWAYTRGVGVRKAGRSE